MHELTVVTSLIELAERETRKHPGGSLKALRCRIGILRSIDPDLLAEAFAMARVGTAAAGATLQIERSGMALACQSCGRTQELASWRLDCPNCGSDRVRLSGGDALELTSLELEMNNHDRGPPSKSPGEE